MNTKPLILVTNDDGITAPGLRTLIEVMNTIGEVVVIAPDSPQSGMGHAITVNSTLYVEKVKIDKNPQSEYSCSGTPVDCVKLAVKQILGRRPDICVSGINHGSNSSINVIYSGTMSAAMEGAIEGIPSIGFSLLNYKFDADFSAARHYAGVVTRAVLQGGPWRELLLNVNIPYLPLKEMKGLKICRQAMAKWKEEFDERLDPAQQKYYWLTGKFLNPDLGEDTDEWALANGYVSVVPVEFDFTAHHAIPILNKLHWNV